MAQDAYGPDGVEAQHRADVLHDAVIQDAQTAVALGELVRLESGRPGFAVLLLPGSVAEPIPNDSRKEPIHVLAPRTVQ
jgi:hypothetical protein